MMQLFLGGEKSGKSDLALRQVLAHGARPLLLVTGRPLDAALSRQVREHRRTRPPELPVRETGLALMESVRQALQAGHDSLLLDSLDFWLFACLHAGRPDLLDTLEAQLPALAELLGAHQARLAVVSCEVSLGPIAADALTRRFVRRLGALHQALALTCDTVCLVLAGLPLYLKGGDPWPISANSAPS